MEKRLSRRALVTTLACTPVVSNAAICPQLESPDAALIALGDQFNRLTGVWDELARQTNGTYLNVTDLET